MSIHQNRDINYIRALALYYNSLTQLMLTTIVQTDLSKLPTTTQTWKTTKLNHWTRTQWDPEISSFMRKSRKSNDNHLLIIIYKKKILIVRTLCLIWHNLQIGFSLIFSYTHTQKKEKCIYQNSNDPIQQNHWKMKNGYDLVWENTLEYAMKRNRIIWLNRITHKRKYR